MPTESPRVDHFARALPWCLAVALLLSPAATAGAEDKPYLTLDDVARLRHVAELSLSPSGEQAAYVLSVPRRVGEDEDGPAWAELHVVDAGGTSRPFVSGEINVEKLAWLPDGGAVAFLAKRGDDEEKSLYEIAIDGGEARKVLSHGDGIREFAWSPDGQRLAFLAKPKPAEDEKELEEKGFKQKVFEEDWRSVEAWVAEREDGGLGEPRRLELEGSASELSWSPDGARLAVALAPTSLIDDHYMLRRVTIVDPAGEAPAVVIGTDGKLERVAWSPDSARLALIAGAGPNDPAAARLMLAPASGGPASEIFPGLEADAVDVVWQDDETLLWIAAQGVETRLERWSEATGSQPVLTSGGPIWSRLAATAGGGAVALLGETPSHPDEVFLLGGEEGRARRLTDSNPWLAERSLVAQEVATWRSRDGLELEGLLMRPPSTTGPVPLVLVVHGGPEAHFSNGWLTGYSRPGQVLAGRGYAVFYPNYRGSTGRGLEFALSSQGDPAGKEFDDLVDAVDHLIATGLVDGDRVGVTGGSYGGYATAWCSTFYSERFAAGVMFVGISEKVAKLGTSDIPNELYKVHARRWPWEDWQLMLERSPVYYVEKAKTPLLIMGGDADPRVHPSQSLVLYRYLKILGNVPVRYVVYPGEEHGNRKAAARLDYGMRLVRWFDNYLKGEGGNPPPAELEYGLDRNGGGEDEGGA